MHPHHPPPTGDAAQSGYRAARSRAAPSGRGNEDFDLAGIIVRGHGILPACLFVAQAPSTMSGQTRFAALDHPGKRFNAAIARHERSHKGFCAQRLLRSCAGFDVPGTGTVSFCSIMFSGFDTCFRLRHYRHNESLFLRECMALQKVHAEQARRRGTHADD